jgi:hypothetical protein
VALQYRHRPLGNAWPGERTRTRVKSPFRGANWSATIGLLEHELRQLEATDVTFVLNVSERDVNRDGRLRADARVQDPAVIVEFKARADRLQFPCDRFNHWHDNLRAIALALEALRKVDRYGVRSGRQYEGFKALPNAGGSTQTMTVAQAAVAIEDETGVDSVSILASVDICKSAIRLALSNAHPDRPRGDARRFVAVQSARAILAAHHDTSF